MNGTWVGTRNRLVYSIFLLLPIIPAATGVYVLVQMGRVGPTNLASPGFVFIVAALLCEVVFFLMWLRVKPVRITIDGQTLSTDQGRRDSTVALKDVVSATYSQTSQTLTLATPQPSDAPGQALVIRLGAFNPRQRDEILASLRDLPWNAAVAPSPTTVRALGPDAAAKTWDGRLGWRVQLLFGAFALACLYWVYAASRQAFGAAVVIQYVVAIGLLAFFIFVIRVYGPATVTIDADHVTFERPGRTFSNAFTDLTAIAYLPGSRNSSNNVLIRQKPDYVDPRTGRTAGRLRGWWAIPGFYFSQKQIEEMLLCLAEGITRAGGQYDDMRTA